ncbi:MAG: hypothetical protein GX032_01615 [Tenericutes bacterium]|jgi:hypothetical protein|nr:hypothetical protein [Bacilli bacterium]MDD3995467.1 hypothetical protein [Bacilli bacterium]MDD4623983.1 hypothetical protein [Bacilli bacterium]MDD4831749.1 hypothetical protein [Bacilli bacterium]NLV90154.1 hypothetical protein [Mycoplasmatota bacterium]
MKYTVSYEAIDTTIMKLQNAKAALNSYVNSIAASIKYSVGVKSHDVDKLKNQYETEVVPSQKELEKAINETIDYLNNVKKNYQIATGQL